MVLASIALIDIRLKEFLHSNVTTLRVLIMLNGCLFCYTGARQALQIYRCRDAGAVSDKAQWLGLCKDVSSILFGIAMGLHDGGAVITNSTLNILGRVPVLCSYYWAQKSDRELRKEAVDV